MDDIDDIKNYNNNNTNTFTSNSNSMPPNNRTFPSTSDRYSNLNGFHSKTYQNLHQQHNTSNMNMRSHLHFGSGRFNHIPQTCPSQSKYSKRTSSHNNTTSHNDNKSVFNQNQTSTKPPSNDNADNYQRFQSQPHPQQQRPTPQQQQQQQQQHQATNHNNTECKQRNDEDINMNDRNRNIEQQNDIKMEESPPLEAPIQSTPISQRILMTESDKKRKKEERDKLIRRNTADRLEELKQEQIHHRNEEKQKYILREEIHPQIFAMAKQYRHNRNPIELIKLFYPKVRLKANATTKDICKAFKRTLANFHPDRTINKPLRQQIRAEEIFKLLSTEKERFEKRSNPRYPQYPQPPNYHRR
eukprot:179043_1